MQLTATPRARTPEAALADPALAVNGGPRAVTATPAPPLVDRAALADDIGRIMREDRAFVWYGGPRQKAFEGAFAELVGARHGVMCSSGTAALQLLLHAAGVRRGSVVAVPDFTFHSVLSCVLSMGAVPFLMAVDAQTLMTDVDRAVAEVPRGAVLVAVHATGRALDVPRLLAERPDLTVVEDTADAQATLLRGRQVGTDGLGACWSFTTSHNEVHTAGVAGMVTTDDRQLADRLRRLAHYGKEHRSVHPGTPLNPMPAEPGYNFMTTEVEAAAGLAAARVAPQAWERRRTAGRDLAGHLAALDLSPVPEPADSTQNFYDVLFRPGPQWTAHEERLLDALVAEGCPAWSYHTLSQFPWVAAELGALGVWGERERRIAEDADALGPVLGIRPAPGEARTRAVAEGAAKIFREGNT
ncbi:hypothetical protein GCM10010260_43820 [Streptomyces filipinensis]|uniref:Uncharacterized protein n=1 Tax=Streptomyces filipinensis TaxID=66887 RepID=A0A918ICT5_9ACTN|nr:aminotransferase class I/II-fold pyridoxal phosphate-dependent enzyme [Streptomyces filipinensis]GGV02278.1 hypothetical protein GCM10010260_43820 [Streptomyces filipinensis]